MEESVNAQLEQMFHQVAKKNALDCGVRTTKKSGAVGDGLRLDAQRRECEGSIVFHAGRALDSSTRLRLAEPIAFQQRLSWSLLRVGLCIQKDRQNHDLARLHRIIVGNLTDVKMADALETYTSGLCTQV